MTDLRREAAIAAIVALLAVGGLLVDAFGGPAPASPEPTIAGDRYVERARFCPPTPRETKVASRLGVTAPDGAAVTVGLEGSIPPFVDLPAGRALARDLTGHNALSVTGFGALVGAGSASSYRGPVAGAAASLCAPEASTQWYFPEGSSLLDFDERLLIYNPFPEEAVVRVTFFTPKGERAKANLADVPVPAGDWTAVAVNDFILRERILGAAVTAVRGRVVAWRSVFAAPKERPDGVYSALGATEAASTWYLPEGAVGPGFDQRIAILNPGDEEAVVTVSLVGGEEILQPKKLSEIKIAPRSVESYRIADGFGAQQKVAGGYSVFVQTTNLTDIVVENTNWYSTADVGGVSSEIGASAGSRGWLLPPPADDASTDVIYLMNSSTKDARVSVSFVRTAGDILEPGALRDVVVPAGLRLKLPIRDYTGGRFYMALVRADAAVVVSRAAYSAADEDVASVMGIPLGVLP